MAKFFLHNNRVGLALNDEQETLIPASGVTNIIEFDEESNPNTIVQFNTDYNSFSFVSGQLVRNEQIISFTSNSSNTTRRKQAKGIIDALENGTATSNQVQKALGFLLRQYFKV